VHQEAYAWGANGYDGIAGLKFTITNHSGATLRQLRIGLFADLDSRARADAAGHVNDRIAHFGFSRTVFDGTSYLKVGGYLPRLSADPAAGWPQPALLHTRGFAPGDRDGGRDPGFRSPRWCRSATPRIRSPSWGRSSVRSERREACPSAPVCSRTACCRGAAGPR
jgi:hypothetical protein